ncbi:uncharacterized protein [Spinacia oleracea]|uniref:Retrovirus-related Pol polyprotein from transposon TNT 1-94-like beta-barrel domain-containing protein n=1 Tax=Spinacia oleracea TaxID=3562 RepID=A0ABM3QZG4_SPIOL|nr:uncharacterized protein LOC110787602 [Spinacia oleracea]
MSIAMDNSMMNKTLYDLSNLEPLDGKNCKTVAPDSSLLEKDAKKTAEALTKKEKDNKLVKDHILHHVNGILFDLLITNQSSKSIWDTLQKKYRADDAGKKKYVVGMKMCETLQDNVLLEKFPPSWNDYRNSLKHNMNDMNLQELIGHMRIEEANRLKDKFESLSLNFSKANLVESGAPMGHKAYQYDHRHKRNSNGVSQANLVEKNEVIVAVFVEANLVEKKLEWILDTGASKHFCANKAIMTDFEDASDGDNVYMGNSSIAGVLGKGKVHLKLTSEKTLIFE